MLIEYKGLEHGKIKADGIQVKEESNMVMYVLLSIILIIAVLYLLWFLGSMCFTPWPTFYNFDRFAFSFDTHA